MRQETGQYRIPRVYHDGTTQSRGVGRMSESFRDAAVERIYDEFRFLDDPMMVPSPSSSRPIVSPSITTVESPFRSRLSRWTFAVIPLSQLLVSLAILTFSVLRMYRLTQNRQIANILLDMEKPEDYAHTAEEGTEIIRTRLGAASFLASCMNIAAALTGLWPFCTRQQTSIRILHIFFCGFSVLLWFDSIRTASQEINLTFVQLEDGLIEPSSYPFWISLLVLSSIQLLIIPTLSLSLSSCHLLPSPSSSPLSSLFAFSSLLFSSSALSLSAYSASLTTKSTSEWQPLHEIVNQGALYSFGVPECIVCGYSFILSLLTLFIPLLSPLSFFSSSLILLLPLSSLSLSLYLLSPTRLLSLIHAVLLLSPLTSPSPVSSLLISSIYGSIFALLISQVTQFAICLSSVLSSPKREQ
uniref:Uncharacterized protein n=1 Tax=Pristionchus pacificus TaxID=54126 RepID=A0A8R1V313_PRIPA